MSIASTQNGLWLKRLRYTEGQKEGAMVDQGGTIRVLDIGNYADEGLARARNSDNNCTIGLQLFIINLV